MATPSFSMVLVELARHSYTPLFVIEFEQIPGSSFASALQELHLSFYQEDTRHIPHSTSLYTVSVKTPNAKSTKNQNMPTCYDKCDSLYGTKLSHNTGRITPFFSLHFLTHTQTLSRHAIEAVDRTLRDICSTPHPFSGITTVFSGNFQQTLSIVVNGTREDTWTRPYNVPPSGLISTSFISDRTCV
jgi:hypothetical protein